MKMDVFDGAIERTILYGMATDDAVLLRVTAFYSNGAFGSQPVDTAARLMMSYGQRHGRAPGKDLTDLFVQWAAGRDEATVRAVELLLQSLDGRGEEALDNPDHVVQLARDHFESVRLARVRDELGVALEKRDVPAARQVLAKYAPLDAQDVPCIDLFHDVVAVRAALEYRHQPPLYEYGGGLGDFFGDALRKGEFLAITAPDKSGKSYLLQDFAWRLATARKRVLYFEAGDLMQSQLIIRFLVRASRIPDRPGTVMIPTGMEGSGEELRVVLEEREFETALDFEPARDALQRVLDIKIKSADPFLQISCHPNSTLKVADIRAVVEQQIRQGWHPDAIIVDYADILAPPPGFEGRDQIDATWRELAALRQRYDCFVATATQCDTDGYSRTTLSRSNFSNDKRKNAHVSSMLGINQTSGEKEQGLYRLNWILRRDRPFNERRVCYVAACLGLANPTVLSQY